MRKVITETTVYTFAELPERAKDKARDWYRQGIEFDARDTIENTILPAAQLLGITIERPRGARTGYAVSWNMNPTEAAYDGTWRASEFKPGAIEKEFPTDTELHGIAASLAIIARDFPEATADCRAVGRYCTQSVDAYLNDDDASEGDVCEAIAACEQTLADFACWIATAINADYEWRHSDECVDESIEANGYEFTESGECI